MKTSTAIEASIEARVPKKARVFQEWLWISRKTP